jgi:hypothetical protein
VEGNLNILPPSILAEIAATLPMRKLDMSRDLELFFFVKNSMEAR